MSELGTDDLAERLTELATLAEPVRLELYRYVAAQPEPVGRDQAAQAVGVPRHTAKFHLDKLAEEGLLDVEFKRLSGREGPGAGRPAKLYRRSSLEVAVSVPPRHYDLAGHLMATAIERTRPDGSTVPDSLQDAAAHWGTTLAERARDAAGPRPSRDRLVRAACSTLDSYGYASSREGARIVLRNCPFHALAREHTELVCGMNLAAIEAMTEGLPQGHLSARLDPAPDRCCVTIAAS